MFSLLLLAFFRQNRENQQAQKLKTEEERKGTKLLPRSMLFFFPPPSGSVICQILPQKIFRINSTHVKREIADSPLEIVTPGIFTFSRKEFSAFLLRDLFLALKTFLKHESEIWKSFN